MTEGIAAFAAQQGEADPVTWVEALEQIADSSFVSGARAAMLREIAEHLRFRHLTPTPSSGEAESRPSPDGFEAFQSEINPDVWYVGDERVAYLRTEVGVGNPKNIAERAAAGLNAHMIAASPTLTEPTEGR